MENNIMDFMSYAVRQYIGKTNGCCALCGKKHKNLQGSAIVNSIKLKKDGGVKQFCGPKDVIWTCPECSYTLWSMWFELFDALSNGEVQPHLDHSMKRIMEMAKKRYAKKVKPNRSHK